MLRPADRTASEGDRDVGRRPPSWFTNKLGRHAPDLTDPVFRQNTQLPRCFDIAREEDDTPGLCTAQETTLRPGQSCARDPCDERARSH